MNADDARERATAVLREIEDPAKPLALLAGPPSEYDWCWLFGFNTVRAIDGDFLASLATGPVVVPKNGNDPWVAPSSPPVQRWLNEYAEQEGLPAIPVPVPGNPFA
jgi:hypothetical protein